MGKVITCAEPLLTTNLGISHPVQSWLASRGTQKWLRTSGRSGCPANQMTGEEGIFQSTGRAFILADSSEAFCGGLEGSFHLGEICQPWVLQQGVNGRARWEPVTHMSHFCIPLWTSSLSELLSYSLNDTIVPVPVVSPHRRM